MPTPRTLKITAVQIILKWGGWLAVTYSYMFSFTLICHLSFTLICRKKFVNTGNE